jgi:hypothetical protein
MRTAALLIAGLLAASLLGTTTGASAYAPLDWVSSYDPGTPGVNATAVGLDGVAYLGTWGSPSYCPGSGARIIDLHDPYSPVRIGAAAAYPGTTAEHLAAVNFDTWAFRGNVLFAGIQRCNAGGGSPSGLAIWDVSEPANPRELSFFATGRQPRGVHEFTVGAIGDRWYAYLAVPNSELGDGRGDLRILEVTDPTAPVEVATWGARRDGGLPIGSGRQCAPDCRGSEPQVFLHSVALSRDSRTAYLSYWDLGVILLDVSEPSSPRWIGRFAEPRAAEGNTHSVSIARDGTLALVADETAGPPWGRLRLVDIQDPTNPVQVGSFESPNSARDTRGGQYAYSIHNPLADDRDPNKAYLAWYADGLRVIDVSDAAAPVEIGSWIPPGGGQVWNVAQMGDLLLLGDIYGGLHVLSR